MTSNKLRQSKRKDMVDFVPPDGGWGWMIVFAAGFSNLCTFPVLQQFGLLFRDKLTRIGISSSQITTIINMNSATTSCVGLANGPLFKTFTFRQVSVVGSFLVFCALLITTFANSFVTFLISFSLLYGGSVGISMSANALALNTYFKVKRRIATGLSWTTTGLGPVVMPQIITACFYYFGERGAVLMLCGLSFHAVACALLLQPVEWHVKKLKVSDDSEKLLKEVRNNKEETGLRRLASQKKINLSAFSSQYIYNDDDPHTPGYEIIDPGTPMLSKANDGYFSLSKRSSKLSLYSKNNSIQNSQVNLSISKRPSTTSLADTKTRKQSFYINDSRKNSATNLGALVQETHNIKPKRKTSVSMKQKIVESEMEDCPTLKAPHDLREEEKVAVQHIDTEKVDSIADREYKLYVNLAKSSKTEEDDFDQKYSKDNQSKSSFKTGDEMFDKDERKYLKDNHSTKSWKKDRKPNNFNVENEILKEAALKLEQYLLNNTKPDKSSQTIEISGKKAHNGDSVPQISNDAGYDDIKELSKLTLCQKISLFFDLDLLKDFTYVNLMAGITIANFSELNFSILTPFILGDFEMSKPQVAAFMSLLAGVDISVRFFIPFVAGKIGWENRSFFIFGVMIMATGRIVLAHCQNYMVVLVVATVIGFGKGLRTVFMALVIPSHVPLEKLPGATGIQLLTAGIVFITLGPIVGFIKDHTTNTITLHCLNIPTYITAISWGLEKWYHTRKEKEKQNPL